MSVSISNTLVFGVVFLLAAAAVSDYRDLKIPNWISLLLCALFLVHAAISLPLIEALRHFGVGAAVFLVAAIAFALRLVGGGDVKLIGACALWAGPDHVVPMLLATGLLGGVLGLIILMARKIARSLPALAERPGELWNVLRWGRDGVCPYGIPIAAAAALTLPFAT